MFDDEDWGVCGVWIRCRCDGGGCGGGLRLLLVGVVVV